MKTGLPDSLLFDTPRSTLDAHRRPSIPLDLALAGVILLAIAFDYINGFHDTANAIATSVATKALPPHVAIVMAASFNFIGAFAGTAVAKTIGAGLVDEKTSSQAVVAAAPIGAIAWNQLTRPDRRPAGSDDHRRRHGCAEGGWDRQQGPRAAGDLADRRVHRRVHADDRAAVDLPGRPPLADDVGVPASPDL